MFMVHLSGAQFAQRSEFISALEQWRTTHSSASSVSFLKDTDLVLEGARAVCQDDLPARVLEMYAEVPTI
jgi:hypothetical protein